MAPPLCHYPDIAVALPAKNEYQQLPGCLKALDRAAARYPGKVALLILANNCSDDSIAVLGRTRLRHAALHWRAISLLPGSCHAGWARRFAFDEAAALLANDEDILASTDADTIVSPDWFTRNVAHLASGADAVAGRALTYRRARATLGHAAARRLNLLGRYYVALDWLRADFHPVSDDPWPRHFYEGGASIALTLDAYRRIGGAPTPALAEDRALFDAVRAAGGRVRHPIDVRVFTSIRTQGRAPGGMADSLARWITQDEDEPLHETYSLPAALDPNNAAPADQLTFRRLPGSIAAAQNLIRARRSKAAPQVETILLGASLMDDMNIAADIAEQFSDRLVPGLGIVGVSRPVNEQHIAA